MNTHKFDHLITDAVSRISEQFGNSPKVVVSKEDNTFDISISIVSRGRRVTDDVCCGFFEDEVKQYISEELYGDLRNMSVLHATKVLYLAVNSDGTVSLHRSEPEGVRSFAITDDGAPVSIRL